jgi:hypothetical protein
LIQERRAQLARREQLLRRKDKIASEVLGNHRGQSQQSRLELGACKVGCFCFIAVSSRITIEEGSGAFAARRWTWTPTQSACAFIAGAI